MKKSVIVIISIVATLILASCCFVCNINRGAKSGEAYLITVDLDESFEIEDVAAVLKQAGATDVVVEKEISTDGADTIADIFFNADDAVAVCNAADELLSDKYFLMGDCTLYNSSARLTKSSVTELWPTAIVFAVILAYVFVRFGGAYGAASLICPLEAAAATAGIVVLTGLNFNAFTIPVIFASAAIALMLTVVAAVICKFDAKKEIPVEQSLKGLLPVNCLVFCALAVALVLVAIFAKVSLLKTFAFQGLIAVVVDAVIGIFVNPACIGAFLEKK